MNITPIGKNIPNFGNIYIAPKNMGKELNNIVGTVAKALYVTCDISDRLNDKNVDIFIYEDKKNPSLRAKVVFADNNLNVYKIDKNKFSTGTTFREITEEISPNKEKGKHYKLGSNIINILCYAQDILYGKIREKSADNKEAQEIKEIFSEQNKENIIEIKNKKKNS